MSRALAPALLLPLLACASPPPPPPQPPPVVEEAEPEPEPQGPQSWDEVAEAYGHKCPGPFFELPIATNIDVAGRAFTITGSTISLAGKWRGPLKIGVLGAIKDADADTRKNIRKAAREFRRLGVHIVLANGDIVGDETGDLPKVFAMLGEELKVPVFAHSGNYEWTSAFTEAIVEAQQRHPHIFNANLLRHIDLGGVHLFTLPGWSVRKFVKPAACFYNTSHVDELKAQLTPLVAKGEVVIVSAHGPPRGRGKQSLDYAFEAGNVGDEDLAALLRDVPVRFGIFSHILEAGGRATSDVTRQPLVKLPMRKAATTLYANVGSSSSFPYAMLDKRTSRGMAAVFSIDDTTKGTARVTFLKLK